jgi:hypothetical protein
VAGQQTQSTAPHERHSYPCQRAYRDVVRNRILEFLTKPRGSWLLNSIQRTARAGFLILDMPARWLMDLFDESAAIAGTSPSGRSSPRTSPPSV